MSEVALAIAANHCVLVTVNSELNPQRGEFLEVYQVANLSPQTHVHRFSPSWSGSLEQMAPRRIISQLHQPVTRS